MPMIEAPTQDDVENIALSLAHAEQTVTELLNARLDGSKQDLVLLQRAIDSGAVEPESEYTLRSFGLALGRVFVNAEPDYDWWMVNDDYGRDPAIRYLQSSLTIHPEDLILKRVEQGEAVDVVALYDDLLAMLQEIIEEGVEGA